MMPALRSSDPRAKKRIINKGGGRKKPVILNAMKDLFMNRKTINDRL